MSKLKSTPKRKNS
jgi:hypothetical protein